MSLTDPETQARQRASVILRVRSGQITATEGARELGISRKSYYQWERKALEGMIESLREKPAGRPSPAISPEAQHQQEQIQRLTEDNVILQTRIAIQQMLLGVPDSKKKPASNKREKS